MDQRTRDMFVCTCHYLESMVDEIISSRIDVPPQTIFAVNQLLSKLHNFSNSFTTNRVINQRVLESNVNNTNLIQTKESVNIINKSHTKLKLVPVTNHDSSSKTDSHVSRSTIQYLSVNSNIFQPPVTDGQPIPSTPLSQSSGPSQSQITESKTSETNSALESLLPTLSARLVKSNRPPRFNKSTKPAGSINSNATQISELEFELIPLKSAYQSTGSNLKNKTYEFIKSSMDESVFCLSCCGVSITQCFYNCMEGIIVGKVSSDDIGMYCCVCRVFVNCSWSEHIKNMKGKNPFHSRSMVVNSCKICNLTCFGSKKVANSYFDLHFMLLHEGRTNLSSEETKILLYPTSKFNEMPDSEGKKYKIKELKEVERRASMDNKSDNQSMLKNNLPASKPRVDMPISTVVPVNVNIANDIQLPLSSQVKKIEDDINSGNKESLSSVLQNSLYLSSPQYTPSNNFPSPFSNAKVVEKASSSLIHNKTEKSRLKKQKKISENNSTQPSMSLGAAQPFSSLINTNSYAPPSKKREIEIKTDNQSSAAVLPAQPIKTIKSADKKKTDSGPVVLPSKTVKQDGADMVTDLPQSSDYPELDRVLNEFLREWEQNHLMIDGGYCAVCNMGIVSYFDWFTHVEDHEGDKGAHQWNETICPKCNIRIYGSHLEHFFNVSLHLYLDKLLTESKS